MAPGGSEELGNVVVSCPAGGGACVVTVAADGTASYERTGEVPSVAAAYGSWNLPSGHGLSVGTLTVAPGGSEERGNVVVSCPAGGAACVVTVSADGTASYERTGGVPSVATAYGSWSLPSGHGLVAGEIRVAPGASRELGNVVVSCPAGSAACVVTVSADGTASYERTGGTPSVVSAYGSWSLPSGHGLSAGTFTVAPGGSEELGNVVVSCPAGGGACVVTVAADGTASYERTGGVPSVAAAYGSWRLPSGHGLVAGEISVAPGGSVERGNVVVSCPAGGAACVVTVAADGTASYARTGGAPSLTRWGYSRNNPTAADLLDHWNEPDTLRSALKVSVVNAAEISERKNFLKSLLDGAGGSHDKAGVRFRNVRLDDMTIIGEKKGISYGQWKSGPAGTLNIEFDYRFAPDIGRGARAWMERAGKMWSWRLLDDFDARVAQKGVKTNHGIDPEGKRQIVRILDEDILVDDIVVIMLQDGEEGYGVNHVIEAAISGVSDEDYEPWLASMIVPPIWFSPIKLESIERGFKPTSMLHEVGTFSDILVYLPVRRHSSATLILKTRPSMAPNRCGPTVGNRFRSSGFWISPGPEFRCHHILRVPVLITITLAYAPLSWHIAQLMTVAGLKRCSTKECFP